MASYIPDEYLMLDNTGPCGHGKYKFDAANNDTILF